jgi:hypothetical protein
LALLAIALVLGVLADVLFDGHGLGLNVLVFTGCLIGGLWVLLRVGDAPRHQGRRWMAIPVLLFAAMFLWHDSPLLVAANLIALAGAVSLGALRRAQPRPQDATVREYAAGFASAGAGAFAGTVDLLEREVPWEEVTRGLRSPRALAVARGAALAVPLLILFGGLFLAADRVFRTLAQSAVPTSLSTLWPHMLVVAAAGWLAAGLLRDLAADRDEVRLVSPDALLRRVPRLRLGATEVTIALGALDALFLAFVVVQARYLFGGRGVVLAHEHLTYAQYARHGFFELLAVSVLVVPVVLAAAATRTRSIRALAMLLVLLELVVAASALRRMATYIDAYGLTELRIYVVGVILWISVVLVWTVPTALYGNGRRFAVGAVIAGFAATAALNALNPDALIVRTNVAHGHVDPHYLASLSDDAVPALLARLPQLDQQSREAIATRLGERRFDHDLLAWNASTASARHAVGRYLSQP